MPIASYVVSFVLGLICGVLLTLSTVFEIGIGFTGAGFMVAIAMVIFVISFAVYMKSSNPSTIHRSQIIMAFCVIIKMMFEKPAWQTR